MPRINRRYLTWGEGAAQSTVAETLRRDFLVSPERADKLSGAWGRHPLLGRMYLPAYRSGTMRVADLRRRYPALASSARALRRERLSRYYNAGAGDVSDGRMGRQ